jgi:hypothetical protein
MRTFFAPRWKALASFALDLCSQRLLKFEGIVAYFLLLTLFARRFCFFWRIYCFGFCCLVTLRVFFLLLLQSNTLLYALLLFGLFGLLFGPTLPRLSQTMIDFSRNVVALFVTHTSSNFIGQVIGQVVAFFIIACSCFFFSVFAGFFGVFVVTVLLGSIAQHLFA